MGELAQIEDVEYQFLMHLLKEQDDSRGCEIWTSSEVYIEAASISHLIPTGTPKNLYISTDPYIYSKNYKSIDLYKGVFKKLYQDFTGVSINFVYIHPELGKFKILKNPIRTVITPWEQINQYQELLIDQLKEASLPIQFENIGNTSRKVLRELANTVFNPEKHKADNTVDLGPERYKNRLRTYIKSEVGDIEQNKQFLNCIDSIIGTAEKTVDLSNKIVHDSNGYRLMTESCVISVITVVNLVKVVHENSSKKT